MLIMHNSHASNMSIGPEHEPKYPKNLEAIFLEAYLDAKPRRVTVILLPNRMIEKNVLHLLDRVTIKVYLNYVKF